MPAKDKITARKQWLDWYDRNRESYNRRASKRKMERRAELSGWLNDLKLSLACSRCGIDHPAVLQFHHKDRATKEVHISNAAKWGWGREGILKEIAKCEVLCANCHFIEHYNLRTGA